MQFRYVFSELGQGLRRNLSMHIAVVLTLFVSITLVGLGVLMKQQADIATRTSATSSRSPSTCAATDDKNAGLHRRGHRRAEAARRERPSRTTPRPRYRYESQEEAFDKVKELYGDDQFDGPNPAMTSADMPQSYWITLKNPQEFEGVTSAVVGLDGVSQIRDLRETLKPLYEWLGALKTARGRSRGSCWSRRCSWSANTIRLAAFARRKEIAIMRLVGASTLYIALPFLLEALVTAAIGVALAGGALGAFMYFGVHQRIANSISFMPWIGLEDYWTALAVIAVLGPLLTLLPTLLLTRKYLKV